MLTAQPINLASLARWIDLTYKLCSICPAIVGAYVFLKPRLRRDLEGSARKQILRVWKLTFYPSAFIASEAGQSLAALGFAMLYLFLLTLVLCSTYSPSFHAHRSFSIALFLVCIIYVIVFTSQGIRIYRRMLRALSDPTEFTDETLNRARKVLRKAGLNEEEIRAATSAEMNAPRTGRIDVRNSLNKESHMQSPIPALSLIANFLEGVAIQ